VAPACKKPGSYTRRSLEKKVVDLMTNPSYVQKAAELAAKVNAEDGIDAVCDYVERVGAGLPTKH
jgi:UDP:flavonoid glycosyltransferase YjiC (YdhE family)